MTGRNPYIITKALNSYLKGSVIIAISGHLVTTTDALIVSWLIGSKAFTAVNLVIPVLTIFSSLMIMLSTGASISISKALGNREKEEVNLSFSSSVVGSLILGIVSSIITYKFTDNIIQYLVHGDKTLYYYATEYLKNFCYAIPGLIAAGVIGNIVRTDGNTRLVSIAVWIGIITNIILDIIFIRILGYGIGGAAIATAINYFVMLLICLYHFFTRYNTLHWSDNIKDYFIRVIKNCKLGFSTSLNNIFLGITLFLINNIMLRYLGNEGIYCWAVCYQILLILQMLLSGIDTSIFAIGGVLLGEDDVAGLSFLYKKSVIYLVIGVLILSGLIIFFPEFFGKLFGNKGEDKLDLLPEVLKIFSLFLFPYAIVMQVRAIYTILSRSVLSLMLCIMEFAIIILIVYFTSVYETSRVWWSFPVSSWVLLFFLLLYTLIIYYRNKNIHYFSLIPKSVADPTFYRSIPLTEEGVSEAKKDIDTFLTEEKINQENAKFVSTVTGFIINNILEQLLQDHKTKIKRFFDINIRIKGSKIIEIIKDDGDRIKREQETELITRFNEEIAKIRNQGESNKIGLPGLTTSYFYMNEQNTFTLTFS